MPTNDVSERRLVPISGEEVERLKEMVRARDRADNVDQGNTAVLRSLAARYEDGITEGEAFVMAEEIEALGPYPDTALRSGCGKLRAFQGGADG